MAIKLRVKQIRSGIGRPKPQRLLLKGLGLRKINNVVEVQDTPAIRGMIRKVSHLVTVSPVE
ncbi:MAG: 50S ribosomal protein L30 [Kofleriaceae bacterium]|nr:50S ribosomal protein L30 [Kofleriaceae bacterium]